MSSTYIDGPNPPGGWRSPPEPAPYDPDKGRTNENCADDAQTALDAWKEATDNEDDESNARDLLTDLLHLIRRNGGDPKKEMASALMSYEAEDEGSG